MAAEQSPALLSGLHGPYYVNTSVYIDGSFILGCRALENSPIPSRGGTVAVVSGRLNEGLDAAAVLDSYIEGGTAGLHMIRGDYAIAIFDAARHTLLLLRDPIGTQPLYYAIDRDRVIFGSQIKAVLAGMGKRAVPDRASLAQLLVGRAGVPLGRTCFEDVRSVRPGEAVVITRESLSQARFAAIVPDATYQARDFAESANAFAAALTRAVARRCSPGANTAVLVSGGLDSAAILGAATLMSRAGKVCAVSYGTTDGSAADERSYVSAIVAETNAVARWLPLEPLGFPGQAGDNVWVGETPVISDVPDTLARAAGAARAFGADHLLMGTWADQVLFPFPPPYLNSLLRRGRIASYVRTTSTLMDWMADVPRRKILDMFFRQAVRPLVPSAVLHRVRPPERETLPIFDLLAGEYWSAVPRPQSHRGATEWEVSRPSSVDVMEATTKWGWAHGIEAQLPFLDADLVALLLAIPGEHALHEGVPKALLRSGMAGLVPEVVLQRRDKGDYTEVIDSAHRSAQQLSLDCLEGGERFLQHGLMTRRAADWALARVQHSREIGNDALVLQSTLVGLDAWLRVFFGTDC